MTSSFSAIALALLIRHKYAVLFPVATLEGPLVTLACGFFVSQGFLNPWLTLLILVISDLVSDCVCYAAGRYGKEWRLSRWFIQRFKFDREEARLEKAFRKRPGTIVLLSKVTHALSVPSMLAAGYYRMDVGLFILSNLLGATIKSSLLMYVGFIMGAAYVTFASDLATASLAILMAVVLLAVIYVLKRRAEREIVDVNV